MTVGVGLAQGERDMSAEDASGERARSWQVDLLGRWGLRSRRGEVHLPEREQRLVALLLLGGPARRAQVAGTLWPDSTEARAAANLRTATLEVRRRAPGLVQAMPDHLRLAPTTSSDVAVLRETVRQGDATHHPLPVQSAYLVGLHDLLPGWYEDWVEEHRLRLHHGIVERMASVTRRLVEEGDAAQALPLARAAVRLEPLRESAHRAVAHIHLLSGDRIAAWRVYEEFHRRSVREFGVAPSAHFEELVQPLRLERQARRSGSGSTGRTGVTRLGEVAHQYRRLPVLESS